MKQPTKVIRISMDVWLALKAEAKPIVDSPNKVLKRWIAELEQLRKKGGSWR